MLKAGELTKQRYKPGEAADILRVSPMTIIRYDKAGEINFDRTATGRRVITRDNLLIYLNERGLVQIDSGRVDIVYARGSGT
jgi:predicted site-specific integrase-resolvase